MTFWEAFLSACILLDIIVILALPMWQFGSLARAVLGDAAPQKQHYPMSLRRFWLLMAGTFLALAASIVQASFVLQSIFLMWGIAVLVAAPPIGVCWWLLMPRASQQKGPRRP